MGATANWLDEEDTVALVHTDQVFQTEEFHGAFIEDSTVSVPIQLAENQTDRYACLEGVIFMFIMMKRSKFEMISDLGGVIPLRRLFPHTCCEIC